MVGWLHREGLAQGALYSSLAIAMCSVLPEGPFPENGTDGCPQRWASR